jgi:hypothetical protein
MFAAMIFPLLETGALSNRTTRVGEAIDADAND